MSIALRAAPSLVLAIVIVIALIAPSAAPAFGGAELRETVQEVNAAVAAEPTAPPASSGAAFTAPRTGSGALTVAGGVALRLPIVGARRDVAGLALYSAAGLGPAQVALQDVGLGVRALVNINGPAAPHHYEFNLSGAVARLTLNSDGSVSAFDRAGAWIGGFPAPWARDALGRAVPTAFVVRGNRLIQIVAHRHRGFAYGVTADPFWIGIGIWVAREVARRAATRWLGSAGTTNMAINGNTLTGWGSPVLTEAAKRALCLRYGTFC